MVGPAFARLWGIDILLDCLHGRWFAAWRSYGKTRGMLPGHDLNWVGGWSFEVATLDAIVNTYRRRDYERRRLKACRDGGGCNEFLFERSPATPSHAAGTFVPGSASIRLLRS